ncbi:exonuclease domain-containing protein [Nitriliruptor alkaliphilus]|uniref:exonuclease domain-containing protein n=1 Tax=Nitriliruptor alkaliphilus TaxID=427918 RepID=UPI000AE72630|nr:exonuclease domain-containing protein [Nitriliruptor alkaliphilus]
MSFWGKLFGTKKPAGTVGTVPHLTPASPQPPPSSPRAATGRFGAVVGDADRIVVVDTETTGVFPSDRVVEVALVTLDLDGRIIDEFDTLIDPRRDVGPTWIHGITASMLTGAPTFEEVCGQLAVRLHGAVVAAHNLPFDARMLASEYGRVGVDVQLRAGLDTLRLTGARLADACSVYGVHLNGAHAALADARATAQLLVALAERCDGFDCLPVVLPTGLALGGRVLRRDPRPGILAPAPYLAQLTAQLHHPERDAKVAAYLDLLDRAMADLHLDGDERHQLVELARELGLNAGETDRAHRRWLGELIETACSDGEVTLAQYDELCRAAHALGIDQALVDARTATFRTSDREVSLQPGTTVCFTGVAIDDDGAELSRELLVAHARRLGLDPVDSVTKSRCQLLVAADTASRSGKAGKARRFEIPIVAARDFLAGTPGGQVPAVATGVSLRETLICQECERAWTRPVQRGRKLERCPDCNPARVSDRPAWPSGPVAVPQSAAPPVTAPKATAANVLHPGPVPVSAAPNTRPPALPPVPPVPPVPTVPATAGVAPSPTRSADEPISGASLVVTVDEDTGVETLRCSACGVHWQRQRVRGRKPHTCFDCR